MKIVYMTPRPFSLAYGGSEVQLLNTLKEVEKLGHHVEKIDFFDMEQLKKADLVHLFGSDYVFGQIADLLNAHKIPYVCSSIFYPVGLDRTAHLALSKVSRSTSWMRKKVLRKAKFVLPNSKHEADLLQLLGVERRLLRVIPNGVDESFIGFDPQNFVDKYLNNRFRGQDFILSVGRIEKRKNSLNLLKAAIQAQMPIVFIGRRVEAEADYLKNFFEHLDKYPLAHHIPFLPAGSRDLANAYAAAKVHALVSHLETPGLASLEAALNGANIVYGSCGPVDEYFSTIGYSVSQNDVSSIANGIKVMMSMPRNCLNQKQIVKSRYTWELVAKETENIYKECINATIS